LPVEGGLLAIACEKIAKLDVPAFIKDSELRFVAANPAFEIFSGYDRDALLGHDIGSLTGRPEDRAWEDMERRALVFAEEQLALCFDETGQEHCRAQIERFVTEDENLFVFGVFREKPKLSKARVAKRNRHQTAHAAPPVSLMPANDTALRVAHPSADFRGLLDALPLGVLLLDQHMSIVHFNSAIIGWLVPLGYSPRIGASFATLVDAIMAQKVSDGVKQARYDRQMLMALAQHHGAAPHRILLGEAVVELSGQHLADGTVLLQFNDVTRVQTFEHDSNLYRTVLENVPEPVFVRDADRRLVFANAAYEEMMGEDRAHFYGMREDEMFPDVAEKLRNENLSVLQTGVEIEREQLVTMPSGVDVPLLTSLRRIEDADGEPYIVGTLADISLLKVSERATLEARASAEELYQQFERILRTMPIGVLILDEDLTISFANAKLKEIVTWPEDRAINGVSFADYVRHIFENGWPLVPGPDLETRIAARCAEMRILKGTHQVERMVADGRYVLVSMTLLDHGQFLITYTDYTEQRLREREITEARAKLEGVGTLLKEATQVMMQGMGVVQENKILYANDKLADVLNIPPHMIAEGADWHGFYDYCGARGDFGDDPAGKLDDMAARLHSEKRITDVFQRRDGAWIKLEVLVSGEGRWLFVVSDISEDKSREVELTSLAVQAEAADKAKSRFLASMGHEVRTPMSGVLGMAELLASSELDARQKTFVDVIIKSGRSLLTIITDILDFAKIDDRSLSLRKAPFDPLVAVEDIILLMAGPAAEKDIELLVRGNSGLKHLVSGDAGRFRQILTKLVYEAIKATDTGHVLVDLSEQKESEDLLWLTVRIEDTGHGFTPEQHRLAFSKFSQFDESPIFNKASAGLSLNIVGGLVDLFGGTIDIESEVGAGAAITVRLPLEIAGEKISEQSALHLRSARVLAFASHPLACGILNEQLAHWGFDGLALVEPEVALGVLREAIVVDQSIELLVVDVQRADDGAMDVIRRVRRDGLFNRLAIIALIPASLFGLQPELEEMNVQAQLHKPVADTLLRKAISDVLKAARRASRQEINPPEDKPAPLPSRQHELQPRRQIVQKHEPLAPCVLVIDANEAESGFFRDALSVEGIGYEIFASEEQAFSVWQQRRPPVMLIDLARDANGTLDFVRFIRAEEARASEVRPTVLIGIGSNASDDSHVAYRNAGLDDVLVKPLSHTRLVQCIRQWSDDAQSQQQLAL
jgi:PAS domain S-box-containing protein